MKDKAIEKKQKKEKQKAEKPKFGMWSNTAFMIRTAWQDQEKMVIVLCVVTALLAVANSLLQLYVTPVLLDNVESHAPLGTLLGTIALFTVGLLLCAATSAYLEENTMYGRIQVRLAIIRQMGIKSATTSFPNLYDDKFLKLRAKSSDATCGNSQATEAVWGTLSTLLQNVLGFILYLFLLFSLDWRMIVVILVTAVAGYIVTKYVSEYEYRHREEFGALEKQLFYIDRVAKDRTAAADIRIFHLLPWLKEVQDKALTAYQALSGKAQNTYIWASIADLVLAFLRNGIAYAYLLSLCLHSGMRVSAFLLYFSAIGGFATWITGILGNLNTLHKQSLDLSTVREFLTYPEPFSFTGASLIPKPDKAYTIELRDVTFRYPGTERNILEHVNLTLHPGEKLAVVGLNGAGKTTLVKLLCGFYDPTEGAVLLNGRDIREYNRQDYYSLFSAVFQDFDTLASTIAANIAQSEDAIDYDRVWHCVDQAGLRAKFESLPDGLETKMNRDVYEDAVALSGGETQRLVLARALYKNAPILMLDEPTAALDPISEAELYEKYSEITAGRSSVYISHRLASTRFCDRIVLIGDARILEEGTHEELLAKGGKYAELFMVQSHYYADSAANETEDAE